MSQPANRKHHLSRKSPPTKRMKLSKRVTSIDDLPPEMICELFEHLPAKDLVVCSIVNKRWHSIFAGFKMHRLIVIDRYYNENDPRRQWCSLSLSLFNHLEEKPLLSNLKHLAFWTDKPGVDLNRLNRFQQLVHLEIGHLPEKSQKVHLNLPRLKVLTFPNLNSHCSLSIDCPLLSTLVYNEGIAANLLELLEVKHPETIKKLNTNMFGAKLAPFKGVEFLVTKKLRAISKATIRSMPRLRELHLNKDIEYVMSYESSHMVGAFDRLKRTLSEFMNEAKKLSVSDFRFRFAGLELANVNVDQIDFGAQVHEGSGEYLVSKEYVYMKNYHLIIEPGALDFIEEVDYTRLMSHVTGEFPHCFFQKFTGITWVNARADVQDAGHFLWFLKSLRSLEVFVLSDTKLSQEFYDQLPASAPSLVSLVLEEGHCENGLQLNFDFIGKLSRLTHLSIYPLSLESLPSLVRWLGRLESGEIDFRLREDRFWICKETDDWWTIERYSGGKSIYLPENPEQIVNFFEGPYDEMLETSSESD